MSQQFQSTAPVAPRLSIGIPAYNEEQNIKFLIEALLAQNQSGFSLDEIIVASDGSTDRTNSLVLEFSNPQIKLMANPQRSGKAAVQNQLLREFTGDFILLLDADTLPRDKHLLEKLMNIARSRTELGLICPSVVPLPAEHFFEKVIEESAHFKADISSSWDKGDNIYTCHGRCRLFSRAFAEKMYWDESIGSSEDAFTFLTAKKMGFGYLFVADAAVNYRSPTTYADHARQSRRFLGHTSSLLGSFGQKEISDNYSMPKMITIKHLVQHMARHPLLMTSYIGTYIYLKLGSSPAPTTEPWEVSPTSKKLT